MTGRDAVAAALVRAGQRASGRHLVLLDALVGFIALGRFLRRHGMPMPPRLPRREDLFDLAAATMATGRALYLEFGVHEGAATRHWSHVLVNPDAVLVGFDSFEGLPDRWNDENPKGRFSTGGAAPAIDDPRVRFVTGWFDDTLPGFEVPPHDSLFVNVDVDLYSSTTTVLTHLEAHLTPGTWLYFDELNDRHHELRALDELLGRTALRLEAVAAAANLRQWLFRVAA